VTVTTWIIVALIFAAAVVANALVKSSARRHCVLAAQPAARVNGCNGGCPTCGRIVMHGYEPDEVEAVLGAGGPFPPPKRSEAQKLVGQ